METRATLQRYGYSFSFFAVRARAREQTRVILISSVDLMRVKTDDEGVVSQMASAIGHGIHRTSLKLERLNALAKSSTLYDDKSREIAETSAVIKLDIQALNESIVELQNVAARSRRDGTGSKSAADHSGTVVDTLKNRLATATKSFKETLTTRQREVKAGEERRAALGVSTPQALDAGVDYLGDDPFAKAMLASGATPSNAFGNLQGMNRANDFVPRPIAPGAGAPPPPGGFAQTQGQMQLYNQNNAYADSRQEALQNVERTITELGGIFQQLATMVSEQGELAIRIDENVDDTLANVDNAQTQLLKYLDTVSSNRWLIMKIFAVLVFFMTGFIIFVA